MNVVYTLAGDANLDGVVNGADLNIVASHYNTYQTSWSAGDFSYDGIVNATDLNLLAENFNQSIGATPDAEGDLQSEEIEYAPLLVFAAKVGDLPAVQAIVDAKEGITPIPEPTSLALASFGCFALLGRRRHR